MTEAIIKRVLDTVRSNRNVDIISVTNDHGARFIEAVITVDGKPIRIDLGCAVTIEAKRFDGASKAFSGSVNEDGTVKAPITQWMLEIPNTGVDATISVTTTKPSKLSTTNFTINVQDSPHKGEEISPDDPEYDVFVQVLAGEAERVAAENARQSREETREVSENFRNVNEDTRSGAENTRVINEASRIDNENARQNAEIERVSKDEQRDKKVNEAVNKLSSAGAIFSNALKGKKSGGIVLMSDISPLEHTLDVKVTGANVGAVKLKKLGKNLINPTDYVASSTATTLDGHVFTTSFSSGALFFNSKRQNSIKAGTYTVTITPVDCTMHFSFFCYSDTDSNFTSFVTQYKMNISTPWSFTFTADTDFVFSLGGFGPASGGGYGEFNYTIQLAAGSASSGTEFEPYIEPIEYAVNEDGTVDGVTSIYPSTTLMTDTAGAVIDVEYNRDINKAFAELYNAIISLGGNV